MREEYDFSQSVKNPYAKQLKEPVTINLGVEVIEYFEKMSEDTDIPYQTLINLYLKTVYGRSVNCPSRGCPEKISRTKGGIGGQAKLRVGADRANLAPIRRFHALWGCSAGAPQTIRISINEKHLTDICA